MVHRIVRFLYKLKQRAHISYYLKSFLMLRFQDYFKFRLLPYFFRIVKYETPNGIAEVAWKQAYNGKH